MRERVIGVVTVLLLAPVTAELLQAYLGDLGGPWGMTFLVVFLAPLYGGIALLVREVSVRTGRGWRGRLLLATAFGVAMATIIDTSLFTEHNADIDDWETIVDAASFSGIGWYAVVTWVGGHVIMSVATPIVVAESLARRPGPWLGWVGTSVVGIGFLAVAVALHQDQVANYSPEVTATEYAVAAGLVVVLMSLALGPLGRPLPSRKGTIPAPSRWSLTGFVGMAAFDLVPLSWAGVAIAVGVLLLVGTLVGRWLRSPLADQHHLAALIFGALLARTLIGFLAPVPQDTTWPEKVGQNVTYLVLVVLLGVAMRVRTARQASVIV